MANAFSLSPTVTQSLRFFRPSMVLAVAALLSCLAIYLGLLRPTQERAVATQAILTQLQQQHRVGQTAKTTHQTLTQFWQALPTQEEFTHLGARLSALAKHHEVTIPGMDYRIEAAKKQGDPRGFIKFQAVGSYEAIRHFLYQLEKTEPYVLIEQLTAERTKTPKTVALTLQIGTFFRPA